MQDVFFVPEVVSVRKCRTVVTFWVLGFKNVEPSSLFRFFFRLSLGNENAELSALFRLLALSMWSCGHFLGSRLVRRRTVVFF